ncbi:mechanosensitive ion channel family protein [Marinimicrococcus flavescens]|uniref:Mechanosensitive ion channel family protein n=1 Tax=Marinimicrococcus flavescens TaxID=3031815 RepID=A0AAP3XRS8_9PROT|nr:mechanosensitive ion channel family protein [Marinimicrococcus flavescens]
MGQTIRPFLCAVALLLLLPAWGVAAATVAVPASSNAAAEAPPTADEQLRTLLDAFPAGIDERQLDALLGVMGDSELRAALRTRLMAELAERQVASPAQPNLLEFYRERLAALAQAYDRLPAAMAGVFLRPRGSDIPLQPGPLAAAIVGLLALGFATMLVVRRGLDGWRRRLANPPPVGRAQVASRLALRFLLELVEIASFPLALIAGYFLLSPSHPAAGHVLLVLLRAVTIVLMTAMLARLMCDPRDPRLRLLPVADGPARRLHVAVVVTALLLATVAGLVQMFAGLGLGRDELVALGLPLSMLPYAWLLFLVWRFQRPMLLHLTRTLRLRREAATLLGLVPVVASLYLVGLWVVLSAAALRGQEELAWRVMASFALLLAAPAAAVAARRLLERLFRDEEASAPAPGTPSGRHLHRLMRAIWIVLAVLAVAATGWIWGFEPGHVGIGGALLRLLFDFGAVLLLAYVGWALIERLIERSLTKARRAPRDFRAQRVATLLPLLRSFLHTVLLAMLGMILLSSIGIEIGPLLAGAGVVGIAIGLGAQSSIADILAGVFFLLENAFHVGDYVEVGNLRGTVEGISLRSLKLRHHRGAVHTLPFGKIPSLTNYSRDWALMRLEFRVKPETDVALLKKLVKRIGQELAADPEMGPNFIEPLKSQGVRRVEDNAIIVGIKYIARPGEQFVIRREAYHRLLKAFQDNGIELVGRGVVVKVEGGEGASAAAGAAAGEVVRRELEEEAS